MRKVLLAAGVAGACLLAGVVVATRPPAPDAPTVAASAPSEAVPELNGPPSPPNRDAFYTPPKDLGGRPGDLLRYRPTSLYIDAARRVRAPVNVWQVLYRSTDVKDGPVAVSGTVAVPESAWAGDGPRPIVSYGVGTHGMADRCAPSYRVARGTERGLADAVRALARGWAVVVTDYEGLGVPGDHTYGVHRAEGRAVLDALRAAAKVPDADLSAAAPVALWGYSQGGAAVASAAEQAGDYAPELKLAGVAAGGVPADLAALVEHLDGSPAFGLVFAGLVGLNAAYPELGIPASLSPSARKLFERARDACELDLVSADFRSHRLSEIGAGSNPLGSRPVLARMAENRVGGVAPEVPVRLYQAGRDEFIPPTMARTLFGDYCRRGATVQFQMYPGRTHGGAAGDGAEPTLSWLADRFAGRPAPNSCGSGTGSAR